MPAKDLLFDIMV